MAIALLAIFGGGDSYKVQAVFLNAGQLVPGNEVRVGGAPIGSITDIELNNRAQAVITMEVSDDFAPLHEGSQATIRATSLSGIANRYISLNPGPNNADEIDDGGVIDADDTNAPVDFDQVFDSLDAETREGLKLFVRGSGQQYDSRGEDANASIEYFPPFLSTTGNLTKELALDQAVLRRFLIDGADTVSAIAERRDDLEQLVSNTSTAMGAIADESAALDQAIALLPDTLRKANTTFVNLRSALDDLEQLVDVSKPATKDLTPFLRELRPLVVEARPTVRDLRELIRTPGPQQRPDRPDRRAAAARAAHRQRLPARDPGARPDAARDRVPAGLHARPRGLDHEVRRGGGLLRRERPLRARHARVQPDELRLGHVPGEPGHPGEPARRLPAGGHAEPLPRRQHPARARRQLAVGLQGL